MSFLLLLSAASAIANPECDQVKGSLTKDQCLLAQSMRIQPAPDCEKRQTQADMNICSFRDYLRSDIALNKTWAQISGSAHAKTKSPAGNSEFGLLLDGQRAWLTYRDKHCSVWAKRYEGGSIAPLAVSNCLTEITKFRTTELKQLLEEG